MNYAKKEPLKGITYMLLAFFFFGIGNAFVKFTAGTYTISQILAFRNLTFLFPLLIYIFFIQKKSSPRLVFHTPNLKSHIYRGLLIVVSLWCIFYGFKMLPMANATALGFSEILFMTIISIPFLKERVNKAQWIAITVGFLGVLIVARPSADLFDLTKIATILMLIGGCLDGIVLLFPRKMGKTDSVLTILFYYALFSSIFAFGGVMIEGWASINPEGFMWLLGVGICSLLGQACATYAFQFASAGILSPMIYSLLLWATLFGYVFWGEIPDIYTIIGAFIVILSGLYVIYESRNKNINADIPLAPEGGHTNG